MESQIPEHFLQVTKCSTSDTLEDGETVIALCTTSGQLLELVDKTVTDSCDIDKVADEITTFTSYDPLQKYYLLHCQTCLVVVKRSRPLCVIKEFKDIVEVKIQDRLRVGRPQIVIWTQNDKQPIITDFVGHLQSTVPHTMPLMTASLTRKLQEMNARVAKARMLMQEKRSARYKALYRFTPHVQAPIDETECVPKVLAWGPPLPRHGPVTDPPLAISHPWRKIHNGKWIIGVPILNNTDIPVSDVRLRLRLSSDGVAEHQLRYRSLVVGLVQRSSSGAEWTEPRHCGGDMVQTQVDIAGRSSAVIVGVLEEPVFRKCSTISISGAIIYKPNSQSDGPDVQDMLNPEVHFNVEDLIQGNLLPFSQTNSPDESDLISVLVSSRSWQLSASPRHRLSAPLTEDLAKMGLLQVKELGCWFGLWHTGGSLAGLLVIESEITIGGHSVRVYAREMKQALQFVHSLFGKWKIEVCKDNVATVQDCIQHLSAELCTLHSIARPNAEYSSVEWDQIRDKLNKLELATDLSFMSHLSL